MKEVNILINYVTQRESAVSLSAVSNWMPLSPLIIYCVPSGLWCLALTILGSNLNFQVASRNIQFVFVPIVFVVVSELLQLLEFTDGTFDVLDIIVSFGFWLLGFSWHLLRGSESRRHMKNSQIQLVVFSSVLALSYLSDVGNIPWNS